jgi:hypothetical protein
MASHVRPLSTVHHYLPPPVAFKNGPQNFVSQSARLTLNKTHTDTVVHMRMDLAMGSHVCCPRGEALPRMKHVTPGQGVLYRALYTAPKKCLSDDRVYCTLTGVTALCLAIATPLSHN